MYALAPQVYPLALEKLGFAPEKLGFAFEKLVFASERHGFASERQGFWFREMPLLPKWFLALTYTIWLRLQFRGLDSAWLFSAHLLVFHARGLIFEPGIGCWIPRLTFWPGDLFGVKNGPEKK